MVKLPRKFAVGDKVFAKVRGYPPWPAKIIEVTDGNAKNARFNVYFYGTCETATCKLEELHDYVENKEKLGKASKRKGFNEGLGQLEEELGHDKPSSSTKEPAEIKDEVTTEKTVVTNKVDKAAEKIDDSKEFDFSAATSSDTESKLVIDEGQPKKSLKRKVISAQNTPDLPEAKRRRVGRPLVGMSGKGGKGDDIEGDFQGEETVEKEIISRSGRKIKPKRFSDSPEISKIDYNRSKIKVKEEPVENHSFLPKKKATLEKKINHASPASNKHVLTKSSDSPSNFLLARTFAGEYVGIKVKADKADSLENDKTRSQWNWSMVRNAIKLKTQLESGEILPEQVKDSLDFNVHIPEDEKRALASNESFPQKYKIKWLRTEFNLLQLDAQIKSSLCLDHASTEKCLEAMGAMLNLTIDPLMLKKHPHIVETVKRLRRYIGNLPEWKLSDNDSNDFQQKAEQIRESAETIYSKFKAMFDVPEGSSFWLLFSAQVLRFKSLTKYMSEEKVFSLMSDPAGADSLALDVLAVDKNSPTKMDIENEETNDSTLNSSAIQMDVGAK